MTDFAAKAREAGLDRLTPEHLVQFERAGAAMKRQLDRLPTDLPVAQEPAHIYEAKGRGR